MYSWVVANCKNIGLTVIVFVIVTVAIILLHKRKTVMLYNKRQKIDDMCDTISPTETIFVSIASFRDRECALTLYHMFEKADCPFRIFVGICQQNSPTDRDILGQYEQLATNGIKSFTDNIRIYSMPADQAQGPMLARSIIEKELYRNEKYYMIIDAHTDFTQGWDTRCIADLTSCKSVKPVLTMHPSEYIDRSHKITFTPPSYMTFKKIHNRSGLPQLETSLFKRCPNTCFRSLFLSCGFIFTLGEVIKAVPFDPHCPYVFFGEEISYAARLFTNGWDTFAPRSMIVYHKKDVDQPTFRENFRGNRLRREMEHEGYHRLQVLLGIREQTAGDVPIGIYGLGLRRSLTDFQNFIGLDFETQEVYPKARLGIVNKPEYDEIFAKFGSLTAYHIALKHAG
jgi:hypothetical protein